MDFVLYLMSNNGHGDYKYLAYNSKDNVHENKFFI